MTQLRVDRRRKAATLHTTLDDQKENTVDSGPATSHFGQTAPLSDAGIMTGMSRILGHAVAAQI